MADVGHPVEEKLGMLGSAALQAGAMTLPEAFDGGRADGDSLLA
jgi:hypothetical protein